MKIALFPNYSAPDARSATKGVIDFFQKRNIAICAEEHIAKEFSLDPIDDNVDFLITLGGDGTLLRVAHEYIDLDAPLVGINLGHLGFMADVPTGDIYASLNDLLQENYTLDDRLVIECDNTFALNDIVIHRARNPSLIELALYANGTYVNSFKADGLICATPNGSTAYSLAAGGPILTPGVNGVVLTPISAHTISNRPIVLSADVEIEVRLIKSAEPIEVIADGIDEFSLETGGSFKICRSQKKFVLVKFKRHDFYSTLRSKLGWTGKMKSRYE